jgi:hypothetical protein
MSFFAAQVGKRPVEQTAAKESPAVDQEEEMQYFAAHLGPCPRSPDSRERHDRGLGAPDALADRFISLPLLPLTHCPLCRGVLEAKGGLYHCAGRCGARWLEEPAGRLVDIAALPFGICGCCQPPQALVRGDGGAICPASGSAHLLLPDGTNVLAAALPHGVCQCCVPPMPLVPRGEALVCLARPEQRYRRMGDQVARILLSSTISAADTHAAIDHALRRNSARLTVNGLFDLD